MGSDSGDPLSMADKMRARERLFDLLREAGFAEGQIERISIWAILDCRLLRDLTPDTFEARARKLIQDWRTYVEEGARDAGEDLARGEVSQRCWGLLRVGLATCPRCEIRVAETPACSACGSPVIPIRSLGCMGGKETKPYIEGYNSAVEARIRATMNPNFAWDRVRDA